MPMRKTVTLNLSSTNLRKLENQLLQDKDEPVSTEHSIRHAVRHYPKLRNEVNKLKTEIYDLQAKLKKIGKSQETIENACQEIYISVHEDEEVEEDTLSWDLEEEKVDEEDEEDEDFI